MDEPKEVIGSPRSRFSRHSKRTGEERRGGRLARLPLTHLELKERMKIKRDGDELEAVRELNQRGLVACEIYPRLGVTRKIDKKSFGD